MSNASTRAEHWSRTKSLLWTTLVIWFIFSYLVHWFADAFVGMTFLGFPVGFYFAGQGAQIVFVLLVFWFASRQNKIDEDCGVAEE